MLQIVWQGPQALQTLRFIGHTYRLYPLQANVLLLMRTT
jgi:hypothetical protein